MFRLLGGLVDRIFAVIGALLFSQVPHFFQHYAQRIGGHVDELRFQISSLENMVMERGKTLQEYLYHIITHHDSDISFQGEFLNQMLSRYTELDRAYHSLTHATPLSRPFILLKYFDYEIAKMTFFDFSPGISFNVETVIYALIGIVFGSLIYRTLTFPFKFKKEAKSW